MSSRGAAPPLEPCSRCDRRRPTADNGRCLVCNSRVRAVAEDVVDVLEELDVDPGSAPIGTVTGRVDADRDDVERALEAIAGAGRGSA